MNVVFNKVLYDLVKELKKLSPVLKNKIRQNYKVKCSGGENIAFFMAHMFGRLEVDSPCAPFDDESIQDVEILKDISLQTIKKNVSQNEASILNSYVYTLSIVVRATDDTTFQLIVKILGNIQEGKPYDVESDKLIDDDLLTLFSKLSVLTKSLPTASTSAPLPPFLENTMIGGLAHELTEEIDMASLGLKKPEDILNHSGSLGTVIGKITEKLQTKISSGSLDPAVLMKEALSLVNTDTSGMFSNPLFADIMKNMMSNNAQPENAQNENAHAQASDVKTRLRKKFDAQKVK